MMHNTSISENLKAEDLDKLIKECDDMLDVCDSLATDIPRLGYTAFELDERLKMIENNIKTIEGMRATYTRVRDDMIALEEETGICRYCHEKITSTVLEDENMRTEYSCGCN